MPPQQPYYQPNYPPQQPGPPQGNYDFIMNPQSPKQPGLFNRPKQLLLLTGIIALVLVLGVVIFSLFNRDGSNSASFIKVAQQQTELIRIAERGYEDGSSQAVKNVALATQLSLETDKSKLLELLNDAGVKVSEKELALGADKAADTAFDNALSTSTFDTTFTTELQEDLIAYRQSLQGAYKQVTKDTTKQALNTMFDNAELLQKQSTAL